MCSIIWHNLPATAWMTPDGNSSRRKALNLANQFPGITEIQSRLGATFATIFFQSIIDQETAKQQIGLEPLLKGAPKELCISPNDILKGKYVLGKPLSTGCIQALTHQSILDIGAAYENELKEDTMKMIKLAVESAELQVKKKMEAQFDAAVQKIQSAEKEKYLALLKQQNEESKKIIEQTVEKMKQNIIEEAEQQKSEELRKLKEDMEEQLRKALEENEKSISRKFSFKLAWNSHLNNERFQEKTKQQENEWKLLLEKQKSSFKKKLQKLQVKSEAEHLSDLMRIYHEKMLEINELKESMKRDLLLCFESKNQIIKEKNKLINNKEKKIDTMDEKIKTLRETMKDVALQFQKFIQFTLKEKPGQGQYLLSIEQLMKEAEYHEQIDLEAKVPGMSLTKESEESASSVMALIIETVMANLDKKNNKEFPSVTIGHLLYTETFEERVEREREVNRKITLITSEQDRSQNKEQIKYLKRRIEAIKKIFPKNPSILNLFLATKAATITWTQSQKQKGLSPKLVLL